MRDVEWVVVELTPDTHRDPRTQALAELLHHIRPAWNRAGIAAGLTAAATKAQDFEHLIRAAIDTALDPSANTPAAIQHRDGDAWSIQKSHAKNDSTSPQPPSVGDVLPTHEPGDYTAGAAAARAAIKAAKESAQENTPPEKENE